MVLGVMLDPVSIPLPAKPQHHAGKYPFYAGREPTSSIATGSKLQHKKEIEALINTAFDLSR
jgi:2-oxoglutarate dehydrogenase E1 component